MANFYNDIFLQGELHDTRQGSAFSVRGKRNKFRRFLVWTTNPDYGSNEICGCAGIPTPYSLYATADGQDFDILAVCTDISAVLVDEIKKDDSRYIWVVLCTYTSDVPEEGIPAYTGLDNDPASSTNLPWTEPPIPKWEDEIEQKSPQRDLDGRPYINSAGQPFTPAFTAPAPRQVLILTRNEINFDRGIASSYGFAVNSDVFMNALPGSAQCYPIKAEQVTRGILKYWRVTYRIRFGAILGPNELNPILASLAPIIGLAGIQTLIAAGYNLESFQPYILDAGLMELKRNGPFAGSVPGLVPILLPGTGQPVSQPVLLDGAGQWVGRTQTNPKIGPNGCPIYNPTWLYFNQFQAQPFNPIVQSGLFNGT
jgi:hypothetical protein